MSLSGGESQRIRLATALGSALVGALYVLDEPTIGLHPRDTLRLIRILERMRDLGNTVIVVEHDADVIRSANFIVDLGPESGTQGGEVIFDGSLDQMLLDDKSATGTYLSGRKQIPVPAQASQARLEKQGRNQGCICQQSEAVGCRVPRRINYLRIRRQRFGKILAGPGNTIQRAGTQPGRVSCGLGPYTIQVH